MWSVPDAHRGQERASEPRIATVAVSSHVGADTRTGSSGTAVSAPSTAVCSVMSHSQERGQLKPQTVHSVILGVGVPDQ